MTVKLLTMALTLSMAVLVTGCGPDCVAACESQNGCAGAQKQDCAAVCEKAEKVNELANCEDQYDDLLICIEDQDDICKTAAQCAQKSIDYQDCVAGYCINNPADCQ